MPSTVTLYTTALEELETLNIDHAEIDTTLHPQQTMREISVRTNFPYDLQVLRNQENLIALTRLNLEGERVEEVCRIESASWTWTYPNPNPQAPSSHAEFELTPLHNDAQQIVKAVIDSREQKTPKERNEFDLLQRLHNESVSQLLRYRQDPADAFHNR